MKRNHFLSDRCQIIADLAYENCIAFGESYCNALLKKLKPFTDKMDDELRAEEIKTLDKLLENIKKHVHSSNMPLFNAASPTHLEQPGSSSSTTTQEASRNFDWMPKIKEIVMTAIPGAVYGDATVAQIAYALGSLLFTNTTAVSIEQARDVIFQAGSPSLTQEQLMSMTMQMADLRRMHLEQECKTRLDNLEEKARGYLKQSYATGEYTIIKGIFGRPLQLEGQYINLQILCTDLKPKKPEEDKELKDSTETKYEQKYKEARLTSKITV